MEIIVTEPSNPAPPTMVTLVSAVVKLLTVPVHAIVMPPGTAETESDERDASAVASSDCNVATAVVKFFVELFAPESTIVKLAEGREPKDCGATATDEPPESAPTDVTVLREVNTCEVTPLSKETA